MEEIDGKLNSNNPVFVSHGISKVLEGISQKRDLVNYNGDMYQIPELKYLLSKCESKNIIVSTTAFEAIISLVEIGSLGIQTVLSNFVMMLGITKNYTALTSAISDLLILGLKGHDTTEKYVCPFNIKSCQHPLITVLINAENIWKDVLGQMHFIMNHTEPKLVMYREEFLRPIFLHILCNPELSHTESCRQHAWHLLISVNNMMDLTVEILQWLRISNMNVCIDSNYRLLELAEYMTVKDNKQWCSVLMPIVAKFAVQLLTYGCDPRPNLCMITDIASIIGDEYSCDITIALLTEATCICPSTYLYSIVCTCSTLISKLKYKSIFAYGLISSLLHWITYPSLLLSDSINTIRDLIDFISSKEIWTNNKVETCEQLFSLLRHSQSDIQFYAELWDSLNTENILPWLHNISCSPMEIKSKCKLILNGLFLQSNDLEIVSLTCKLLLQISNENGNFCCHFLSSVLHKLTKTYNYEMHKILLFAIPELIKTSENVPVILSILEQLLSANKPLKYVALELYVRAWKHEKKCHRYLIKALSGIMEKDDSWQCSLICAKIMKIMCETRPEACIDLVQMLSQILNKCGHLHGSGASALVLDGISALCKCELIDVESTWRVLAPKLKYERRPIVLKALCSFLGDIPTYASYSDDCFLQFLNEIQTKLWDLATSENLKIAESAINALSSFKLECMTFNMLPEKLKSNINITDYERSKIQFITSACWGRILENVNPKTLSFVGSLLINHVKKEVEQLPNSSYKCSQEPNNFLYLSENSIIKGIGEYLRCFKVTENEKIVLMECLRIFAEINTRPLPPVKWNFLGTIMTLWSETKKYVVPILCRQASISSSAKCILEKYLTSFYDKSSNEKLFHMVDCSLFYANLENICKIENISQTILPTFLTTTSEFIFEKALMNDKQFIAMFQEMMMNIANTLSSKDVHEHNKVVVYETLEQILERLNVDSKLFKCAVSAVQMPNTQAEMTEMSLFTKWKDFCMDKLKKVIIIETEFILKNLTKPLLMSNLINAVLPTPRLYGSALQSMYKIHTKLKLDSSSIEWMLHLMTWIRITTDEGKKDSLAFLCDVLLICVICISRRDYLLTDKDLLIESKFVRTRLFPLAMYAISETMSKDNTLQYSMHHVQIMAWLNHSQQRPCLEMCYRQAFHNSIVAMKYTKYFTDAWSTYVIDKIR